MFCDQTVEFVRKRVSIFCFLDVWVKMRIFEPCWFFSTFVSRPSIVESSRRSGSPSFKATVKSSHWTSLSILLYVPFWTGNSVPCSANGRIRLRILSVIEAFQVSRVQERQRRAKLLCDIWPQSQMCNNNVRLNGVLSVSCIWFYLRFKIF